MVDVASSSVVQVTVVPDVVGVPELTEEMVGAVVSGQAPVVKVESDEVPVP